MPFPREWADARQNIEEGQKDQDRRLHSLEKQHEQLRRDLMQATSEQTLALEKAIGKLQITLVRISVSQTVSFTAIVLILKYLLKVL